VRRFWEYFKQVVVISVQPLLLAAIAGSLLAGTVAVTQNLNILYTLVLFYLIMTFLTLTILAFLVALTLFVLLFTKGIVDKLA
jgi:hypothetical protein